MSNHEKKRYWFAAKKRGWGWGLPLVWQGWVVLLGYIGLMVFNAYLFPPEKNPLVFAISTVVLTITLLVICWFTGEPPGSLRGKK